MRTLLFAIVGAVAVLAIAARRPAGDHRALYAQSTVSQAAAVTSTLDSLGRDPNGIAITANDLTEGARTIGAREHVAGSVGSWHGPLTVLGTVDGSAVAIGGDVTIEKGARVRGDALAVGGTVVNRGTVDGEVRTLSAITVGPPAPVPLTPAQSMRRAISLATGWYLVLGLIGIGIILIVRPNLESVSDAVRVQTMRSFLIGILGQIGLLPAFVLMVVALAITIIGIAALPFAIVGYVAAAAGALALGFIAAAYLAGQAIGGARNGDRSFASTVQPMVIGLTFFLLLWVAGTAFPGAGGFALALRFLSAFITWIALTVGFGAVLVTRGGTRTVTPPAAIAPVVTSELEWQTPTPVSGVAAARRPTPAPRRDAGAR
ncbi:MAG TPA: polymer-forming cytoskeletal protein [Gemmatimonadaceae bacterium]|nr:polymer-forming cytoskeletal protein [Gemmatimonadaceae bacterium]